MDKCNKIEFRNGPLIHSQLIFTNVQRQLKRKEFFFLNKWWWYNWVHIYKQNKKNLNPVPELTSYAENNSKCIIQTYKTQMQNMSVRKHR